jgi:hypothetical protein
VDATLDTRDAVAQRALRVEWAARSLDTAWAFPSDWSTPAVEALCEAIVSHTDVFPAAERLGRARAAAGIGLGETLADIDQLAALVPARHAEPMRRAASLGWADGSCGPTGHVFDPLTGLVSREYLELRLGELYQAAAADDSAVGDSHALTVVRLDLPTTRPWERMLPMIVLGECLRMVFDAGETLARLGEPMAAVLVPRRPELGGRVRLLTELLDRRVTRGGETLAAPARVWIESLPVDHQAAKWLLADLGR